MLEDSFDRVLSVPSIPDTLSPQVNSITPPLGPTFIDLQGKGVKKRYFTVRKLFRVGWPKIVIIYDVKLIWTTKDFFP